MAVCVIDTEIEVKTVRDSVNNLVYPPNHIYQFKSDDNAHAKARVSLVIDEILSGKLPIDSDYWRLWDEFFPDWVSLRR